MTEVSNGDNAIGSSGPGLTTDDFNALQDQLNDLKTSKYAAEQLVKKLQAELNKQTNEATSLEGFFTKTIFRKKISDPYADNISLKQEAQSPTNRSRAGSIVSLHAKSEDTGNSKGLLSNRTSIGTPLWKRIAEAMPSNQYDISLSSSNKDAENPISTVLGSASKSEVSEAARPSIPDLVLHESNECIGTDKLDSSHDNAASVPTHQSNDHEGTDPSSNERMQQLIDANKSLEERLLSTNEIICSLSEANENELSKHTSRLHAIEEKMNVLQLDKNTSDKQIETLKNDNKILKEENLTLLDTISKINGDLDTFKQLAANRKSMVDKLAKEKQDVESAYIDQLQAVFKAHALEKEERTTQMEAAMAAVEDARKELAKKLKDALEGEEAKEKGITKLGEERDAMQLQLEKQNKEIIRLEQALLEARESMKLHMDAKDEEVNSLLVAVKKEEERRMALEDMCKELHQELADITETVALAEKKHVSAVRDLKKELRQYKRLCEKSNANQEDRLQPIATPKFSHSRSMGSAGSAEPGPLRRIISNKSQSSVDSNLDITLVPSSASTADEKVKYLESINAKLISKITVIQAKNLFLREQVQMGVQANELLSKNIAAKTYLLDKYIIRGKHIPNQTSTTASKRSLSMQPGKSSSIGAGGVQPTGLEGDQYMYRTLQSLLEDTITSNIELQKNVELLGKENEKLRLLTENTKER